MQRVCKDTLGVLSNTVISRNSLLGLSYLVNGLFSSLASLLSHLSFELFSAKDFYPKMSLKRKEDTSYFLDIWVKFDWGGGWCDCMHNFFNLSCPRHEIACCTKSSGLRDTQERSCCGSDLSGRGHPGQVPMPLWALVSIRWEKTLKVIHAFIQTLHTCRRATQPLETANLSRPQMAELPSL